MNAKAVQKKQDKKTDAIYRRIGDGVQIDIFDISKVFATGRTLQDQGKDDAALEQGLQDLLAQIRKN